MKAYSQETRQAIVQAVEQSVPHTEIVRRFNVSPSTINRYARLQREQGHMGPKQPELPPELTRQQIKLVCYVAQGLSNAEIAELLGIHEHTVRNRVHRLLEKLNLARRSQIVIFAHQRRLINLDEIVLPGDCYE